MEAIGRSKFTGPVRLKPMAPWPYFSKDEIQVVEGVLTSGEVNYWTGREGRRFEEEFAANLGVKYAVGLTSGTVALELAFRSLDIGPDDEVIVPARTFVACASSAVLSGAKPVFADVDVGSQNITAETIEPCLTDSTKAIVCVHLAGWPCDMDPILELARVWGVKVIEDCAQAQGARYKGRQVGSIGDVGVFSFCQDKIMTTGGEGGMLVTNDDLVWEKAWSYKDHGKDYETLQSRSQSPGFRWIHHSFGTNWRLTEMQSALGRVILPKVPEWLEIRQQNATYLTRRLDRIPGLRVARPPADVRHAYYKYYTFVRPERLKPGWDRDRILIEIEKEGIPCFSGSCSEVYRERAFREAGLSPKRRLTIARMMGKTSLMFLVHPTLGLDDMEDTALAVEIVLARATW
jgi:hypothetical protein